MSKDKALDDFFRKNLESPEQQRGYREEDWDALQDMLDNKGKRRRIVFWLPALSSIAALLLLFLGWWLFRPQPVVNHGKKIVNETHQQKPDTGINGGPKRQLTGEQQQSRPAKDLVAINNSAGVPAKARPSLNSSAIGARRDTTGIVHKLNSANDLSQLSTEKENAISVKQGLSQAPSAKDTDVTKSKTAGLTANNETKKNPVKIKVSYPFRPKYTVGIIAAPDINGVGSFQQAKVGINAGLLFTAGVSKKFSVSMGIIYSAKPYTTGFQNYHTPYTFATNPSNVTADCRMLDIPLNIGYQVFNRYNTKISIGGGLSSYIMLHQNFTFNYSYGSVGGPSNYNVQGSSKYLFGVANLNATYERQINSKFGLSLQPYLKLPLTNIGYSKVRLQTTGVAVGLTWNLNSIR